MSFFNRLAALNGREDIILINELRSKEVEINFMLNQLIRLVSIEKYGDLESEYVIRAKKTIELLKSATKNLDRLHTQYPISAETEFDKRRKVTKANKHSEEIREMITTIEKIVGELNNYVDLESPPPKSQGAQTKSAKKLILAALCEIFLQAGAPLSRKNISLFDDCAKFLNKVLKDKFDKDLLTGEMLRKNHQRVMKFREDHSFRYPIDKDGIDLNELPEQFEYSIVKAVNDLTPVEVAAKILEFKILYVKPQYL